MILCAAAAAVPAADFDFSRPTVGLRSGFSTSQVKRPFVQTEVSGTWDLPWKCQWGSLWSLTPRAELTAGYLRGNGDTGFVGTMGPNFVFRYGTCPVTFDMGISATILSREAFGSRDFGFPVEFTSHAGLNYDLTSRWQVGCRFQHMSNASLGESNPGINMLLFGAAYHF